MIRARALVVRNVIEVEAGRDRWTATPVVSGTNPIARRISSLFSTTYETHLSASPNEVRSTVSYHPKKDEIIIQVGEEKVRTQSTLFGPMVFSYAGQTFQVAEKLTGKFGILRDGSVIAFGQFGFHTCSLDEYPPELETFLADFALGYLIRTIFWTV